MTAYQAMPLIGLAISFFAFTAIWFLQRRLNDAGIVDVFWSLMVASISLFYCIVGFGIRSRRIIAAILVSVWAFRLSYYLLSRWLRSPEDRRYAALKAEWGKTAQVRLYRFYQLQAMGCVLFSIPIFFAANNSTELNWLDFVGVAIFAVSLIGEWVADRQLDAHRLKSENAGKVCKTGLWKYTRHPNYFFEWTHWFSYVFLAITTSWGWVAFIAPIGMYYFLTQKTGIPETEKQALKSKGDAYREYQKTTNAFFPWFPKSVAS
jgi:steroid 5-alpha reductase family enzyme